MKIDLNQSDIDCLIDALRFQIRTITDEADEEYLHGNRGRAGELLERSNRIYITLDKLEV